MFDGPTAPALNAPQGKAEAEPKKIAVVGSGIAGLSAAWLLTQKHNVTLFEAADYLGGHSNTVEVNDKGRSIAVDTGFVVFNQRTYPNLTALLKHVSVGSNPSNMSFSVSLDAGRLEYAGAGRPNLLFAQPRNIFRPAFLAMVSDIARFFRRYRRTDSDAQIANLTLEQLMQRDGYSKPFIDWHVTPMAAAIWSGSPRSIMQFPALTFIHFFRNHGLLNVNNRPEWRTVAGGSREYVKKLILPLRNNVHVNRPVQSVFRDETGVTVHAKGLQAQRFDDVIFATHADQALALLNDPSADEKRLLSAFPYQRNKTYLHRDPSLMPKRKRVWSSWNHVSTSDKDEDSGSSVTYWMNRLHNLSDAPDLFVSLNPSHQPRDESIVLETDYRHPQFNSAAVESQKSLWQLQGNNRSWFCGSYFGYGFHEDALNSGLAVAQGLGVTAPWDREISGQEVETTVEPMAQPNQEPLLLGA